MKNGLMIKILYLTPCINGRGDVNPYIGMSGVVSGLTSERFHIFTGNSWLVGIELNKCKFKIIG
jgi:hypothetical protein